MTQDEPRSKGIRRKLHLSQEQFARRYKIPLETVQEWEKGRSKPTKAEDDYLTVISREPEFVAKDVRRKERGQTNHD